MIAQLGFGALTLTLLLAVAATVLALLSGPRRRPDWLVLAHRAALLTWPALTLSALCLVSTLSGCFCFSGGGGHRGGHGGGHCR